MSEECKHDWQPTDELLRGRFRCCKCFIVGYRAKGKGKEPGPIVPYKRTPNYISELPAFEDYPSFYGMGEYGRCPTMDEQERQLFDHFNREEEEDT